MDKIYCRKCMKELSQSNFYTNVDMGFVDANGYMSVCKSCIQNMYDEVYAKTNNMEETIHKLCTSLNIKYSNDAVSALRAHMETLMEQGKNVHSIFGIYKMKLVATKSTMDKSEPEDMTYEDVNVIYTEKEPDAEILSISNDVISFWGETIRQDKEENKREDIAKVHFLNSQYENFKQTHKADTYSEITLLKQVCYTLWDIEQARKTGDDTDKLLKTLQTLMGNLAISPKESNSSKTDKDEEAFGLWIRAIEENEPAQWLSTDPRGDMYRDVGNVGKYFEDYFVRPLKNFVTQSKDFKINNEGDEITVTLAEEESEEDLNLFDDLDE